MASIRPPRAARALCLAGSLAALLAPHAAVASDHAQVRVVGGPEAGPGQAPWMAAIVSHSSSGGSDARRQFCGGSLIAPAVVMTAAHCVRGRTATGLQVVLGRDDLSLATGSRHDVSGVLVHPLFAPAGFNNDVALLLLARPSSQPVMSLVTRGDSSVSAPWQRVQVLGWGSTSEGGSASPRLRAAGISVLPNRACSRPSAYGADFAKAQMLCAGTPEGGVGSCSGDSGGPLSSGGVAIGVVSWARGCVRPGLPTVFTRLANPSINGWVRNAAAALAAGHTVGPPPQTLVRAIRPRARSAAPALRFSAPGEDWAAFQCSTRGRRFRTCPGSVRPRPGALKAGALRVRALDIFGAVDPTPVAVHASNWVRDPQD